MGYQRWHTWCCHTAHAICWKFGMTYLMSHTGQCLLAEASTDVPRPVIVKQHYLQRSNQCRMPWQHMYQYLPVQKGEPYVTGQFLLLRIVLHVNTCHFTKRSMTILVCEFRTVRIYWAPPASAPRAQNVLNFMQFFGRFGKIVCWCPSPRGLAPPATGSLLGSVCPRVSAQGVGVSACYWVSAC